MQRSSNFILYLPLFQFERENDVLLQESFRAVYCRSEMM